MKVLFPKPRTDDTVNYDLHLGKDGTFRLRFEVEVPEVIWKVYVQQRFGRNPPPKVKIPENLAKEITASGHTQEIIRKIFEDAGRKVGFKILCAGLVVEEAWILMVGSHKYKARVIISGAWEKG